MPRIEIGAGVVLAVIATFGVLGSIPVAAVLLGFGIVLILYGGYEEWVKPRFRVEHRLVGWFLRRAWSVKLERRPQFNFLLRLSSASSEYEVYVTRAKNAYDDLITFTGWVQLHETWLEVLSSFSGAERELLLSDIRVYLTAKNLSFDFAKGSDGRVPWPPVIMVATAIAQDHTLSQHSVDVTAKSVELSVIGAREVVRRAVLMHVALAPVVPSQPPSPESDPDTEEPQPQSTP